MTHILFSNNIEINIWIGQNYVSEWHYQQCIFCILYNGKLQILIRYSSIWYVKEPQS